MLSWIPIHWTWLVGTPIPAIHSVVGRFILSGSELTGVQDSMETWANLVLSFVGMLIAMITAATRMSSMVMRRNSLSWRLVEYSRYTLKRHEFV